MGSQEKVLLGSKRSVTVPEPNGHGARVAPGTGNEVRLAIRVHVTDGDERPALIVRPRPKGPVTIPQQDSDPAGPYNEVRFAVRVQVSERDRTAWNTQVGLGSKASISVPEKHGNSMGVTISHHEIEIAVAVQVPDPN